MKRARGEREAEGGMKRRDGMKRAIRKGERERERQRERDRQRQTQTPGSEVALLQSVSQTPGSEVALLQSVCQSEDLRPWGDSSYQQLQRSELQLKHLFCHTGTFNNSAVFKIGRASCRERV